MIRAEILTAAPQFFPEWTKPSELAENFRSHAKNMIDQDLSLVAGNKVIPRNSRGFEIEFEQASGDVLAVRLRTPSTSGSITHKIGFTPAHKGNGFGIVDGSSATFEKWSYDQNGAVTAEPETFTVLLLGAGDHNARVNEFFCEMARCLPDID